MQNETRKFSCDTEGMAAAQAFLESLCESPKPAIVMDEIVSNIVRCSGASGFSISLHPLESGGIEMVFSDDGHPFDPLTDAPTPDVTAGVESRGIGGLGIFIVKKMAKTTEYRREDGRNVLTVVM